MLANHKHFRKMFMNMGPYMLNVLNCSSYSMQQLYQVAIITKGLSSWKAQNAFVRHQHITFVT